MNAPRMAFFGSSLVSSYWNGAATYYRGLLRALSRLGWRITFFEPDAYDRQAHRDIPNPEWAEVIVYPAEDERGVLAMLDILERFDILVKASGVGVFDALLEQRLLDVRREHQQCVFWDVDAPATIERLRADPADPFHACLPHYDLVLTYGGGPPVIEAYTALGARRAVPVYNAVDPEAHYPVPAEPRFAADVSLLVNRLPDREARIDEFLVKPADALPARTFVLGGSGWADKRLPANVRWTGHVPTADHNAFNASARLVLSVNRDSMARLGYSPATRIFEAAGAGACLVSDAWPGLEEFLEPGREVFTAASGDEVAEHIESIDPATARAVGRAAMRRVLADHTYERRALDVELAFGMEDRQAHAYLSR